MNLFFDKRLTIGYTSQPQKIRVMTESWVNSQIFCPNCGHIDINRYSNNQPVADFFCSNCKEEYELKSKKQAIGNKIVDGAYRTMIERLRDNNNPNFFLLNYSVDDLQVLNFLVIPKHFFVPEIIEERKPLSHTAQRAGWIGCNILMESIPESGKIFFVRDKNVRSKENILVEWKKTLFLREEKEITAKGWVLDIMNCIGKLGTKEFSLDEIYAFENLLNKRHPNNKHIRDKIRQQLQILRDKNYLEFLGNANYRLK